MPKAARSPQMASYRSAVATAISSSSHGSLPSKAQIAEFCAKHCGLADEELTGRYIDMFVAAGELLEETTEPVHGEGGAMANRRYCEAAVGSLLQHSANSNARGTKYALSRRDKLLSSGYPKARQPIFNQFF